MSASAAPAWAGLTYGRLEAMLSTLHDAPEEVVRARFRKLRLRPFPGEIRTGTGRRVAYDLSRSLAIAAVFELNRLYVPQGVAVDMVERAWPEWSRTFVAAAVELGVVERPSAMPAATASVLRFAPCALDREQGEAAFAVLPAGTSADWPSEAPPMLVADARRIVSALARACELSRVDPDELARAFDGIERKFGWTPPDLPRRAELSDVRIGTGFLEEGPYLGRAEALLAATSEDFDARRHPARRLRLSCLLAYLEEPAPVDVWKERVAQADDAPRLGQLVSMFAEANGLAVARSYPGTMAVSAGAVAEQARALVANVRATWTNAG